MDNESKTPKRIDPESINPYALVRHDGWTGEKMAKFCEVLAETAVVQEACEQAHMGVSGAYACRRRNPVFAAAWDAALTIARERLADTLLARSMEGNIEQIWKDGEVVGERHLIDNRLGLAILRRLDRLAETGVSLHSNLQEPRPPAAVERPKPFDWELAVEGLRAGDEAAVCKALALVQGDEVEEVEDPSNRPPSPDGETEEIDLSDRCWRDDRHAGLSGGQSGPVHEPDGRWLTDFPPPRRFKGYENRPYDEHQDVEPYERECTREEVAILEADQARASAAERAEDEELRDKWFKLLEADIAEAKRAAARTEAKKPRRRKTPASPGQPRP